MSELARAVVRIEGDISDLSAALQLANEEMNKAGKAFQDIGEQMFLKVTLPLSAIGGLAVKEFGESADAIAKVNAVLAATGNISGQTTDGILALAASLEKTTRFSETSVVAAAGLLATFQQVRNEVGAGNDIFDRAIKVATDLSSVMGTDLTTSIHQLGRALEDPTTGLMLLRRAGIQFNVDEQFQIKTLVAHGQILEAQRMILDKVAGKTRDAAKAMADTPLGHFAQMWNSLREALQSIGAVMVKVLVPLADMIKALADDFRALPVSAQTVIVVIAAIAAGIGPLLLGIAQLSKAITFIRTLLTLNALASGASAALGAIKIGFLALISPIGIVAVALGILTIGWLKAQAAAEATKQASQAATDAMIAGFATLSPEQVQRRITRITDVMTQWQAQVDALKTSMLQAGAASAGVSDMAGPQVPGTIAATPPMTAEEKAAKAARIQALQEQIERFKVALDALKALGAGFKDAGTRANEQFLQAINAANLALENATASAKILAPFLGPTFNEAAVDAQALQTDMQALADALAAGQIKGAQLTATLADLRTKGAQLVQLKISAAIFDMNLALKTATNTAAVLAQVLGPSFNESAADATALRAQIDATITRMTEAKATTEQMAAALHDVGLAWQATDLQAKIVDMDKAMDNAIGSAKILGHVFGPTFNVAGAEAEAVRQKIQGIVTAMEAAGASTDAINAKIGDLGRQLQDLEAKAKIGDFFVQQFGNASDAIIDFAFGAQKSIGDFIRQALSDFAKLILRIELMKLIMGIGGGIGGGGGGTFGVDSAGAGDVSFAASGGSFPPGSPVVVGEAGPELIRAGRTGMTVAPMSGAKGDQGERLTVPVTINVNAVDQKSVADFFENNQGAVAGAVMKAVQRSRLLRQGMG